MSGRQTRFEAMWTERRFVDSNGAWNPDEDEYGSSYHSTREEAEAAAVSASKKIGIVEWFSISEQDYIGHEWVDQRRWTGDWEGNTYVTFTADEGE